MEYSCTNLAKSDTTLTIEDEPNEKTAAEKTEAEYDDVYQKATAIELPLWRRVLNTVGGKIQKLTVPATLVIMVLRVWYCFAQDRLAVKRNLAKSSQNRSFDMSKYTGYRKDPVCTEISPATDISPVLNSAQAVLARSNNLTNFFREVSNGDNYGEVQPLIVYSLQDKQGMTLSMSDVVDSAAKTNLQGLELDSSPSVSCSTVNFSKDT